MTGTRKSNRKRNENELVRVRKGVDEVTNENAMRRYGHTKRMNENKVGKSLSELTGMRKRKR